MTNGQAVNETPNQRRGAKLLLWAICLIGIAAFVASGWQWWTLVLSLGLFATGLLFGIKGLMVQDRDRNED